VDRLLVDWEEGMNPLFMGKNGKKAQQNNDIELETFMNICFRCTVNR